MSEEGKAGSRKVRKTGSKKPAGRSPKPEEKNSATDTPRSELKTLPTANSKLQTKKMEVHHHPQLHHEKKPWKEYLLEGLMIFLAVMMGFFAENLREHLSDSNREKEYAKALYTELRDDSVSAAHILTLRIEKAKDMDYLYSFFKDSSLTALPRQFYPAFTNGLYLINSYAFEPKDGVLSQLRSSGSERYFKSISLQKLLGELTVAINNMRYRNEQEYQFFASPLKPFLLKHFDFSWLDQLRKTEAPDVILTQLNTYRHRTREIKGSILNAASLDRVEAANMVVFYKQMLLSTQTLQLNNYILANKMILQELRQSYPLD